jgi:hypothetical protein
VLGMSGFTVASEAEAAYAISILHTMTASFQMDAQWEARSQRNTRSAQAERERSRVVSRDKGFDVTAGWEARNKTIDKVFEKGSDARRGTTVTQDPVWGSRTVAKDYNYYWTRPDGSIVGTATDTPPRMAGAPGDSWTSGKC